MKVRVAAANDCAAAGRAAHKVVVEDVHEGFTRRIAAHVVADGLPVTDDVVDEFADSFDLRIARVVINVEGAQDAHAAIGLDEAACGVTLQTLRDDRGLDGDVGDAAADGKSFITAPRGGDVIEDHVVTVGDAHRVCAACTGNALPHADEAGDIVVRAGERKTVAIDCDAIAGRGLAGDGDVGLGRVTRCLIINHPADIENNGASRNADCIAERSRAGIRQRGDVLHRAAASADGEFAETLRAGEGGELGRSVCCRANEQEVREDRSGIAEGRELIHGASRVTS